MLFIHQLHKFILFSCLKPFEKTNKFFIKNLVTPDINVDEIIIINNDDDLNIQASGKKINLPSLNKNLRNKTYLTKDIILDLTADLINASSSMP